MKKITALVLLFTSLMSMAKERNLVLVTIDGLRWQEVFQGKQLDLLNNKDFTHHKNRLLTQLEQEEAIKARKTLMPFVWSVIAKHGA